MRQTAATTNRKEVMQRWNLIATQNVLFYLIKILITFLFIFNQADKTELDYLHHITHFNRYFLSLNWFYIIRNVQSHIWIVL